MHVYLGVDIGTSGSKGVLVDARGRVLARADRAHETAQPLPGHVEHDAEAVWWGDFVAVVRELLPALDDGTELAGPLANPDEAVLDVAAATYPAVTAGPEGATDAIDLGDVVLPAGTNILVHAFGPDSDAFSAVVFTIGGLTTPDGVPAGSAGLVDEGAGAGFGWAAGGAALLLMVLVAAGILVRRQTVSAQR